VSGVRGRGRRRRRTGQLLRRDYGFVGFPDRSLGALIKASTRRRWHQAVDRAQQQSHAKPILELRRPAEGRRATVSPASENEPASMTRINVSIADRRFVAIPPIRL
jgi:hypothetical protein